MKKNYKGWWRRNLRAGRPFILDFFVVVLGIMLSLWLNDRRQQAEIHKGEREILEQVLEDLKEDTAKVNNNLAAIDEFTKRSMKLIQMEKDSIALAFPGIYNEVREVVVYVAFEPSRVGYTELAMQGKSGTVADKKLVMDIMGLYEESYKSIGRLTDAHKEYLINTIYAYITQKMPYFGRRKDITEEKTRAFENALTADEFRHMLFFDIAIKQNLQEGYRQVQREQKKLLEDITGKLKK